MLPVCHMTLGMQRFWVKYCTVRYFGFAFPFASGPNCLKANHCCGSTHSLSAVTADEPEGQLVHSKKKIKIKKTGMASTSGGGERQKSEASLVQDHISFTVGHKDEIFYCKRCLKHVSKYEQAFPV